MDLKTPQNRAQRKQAARDLAATMDERFGGRAPVGTCACGAPAYFGSKIQGIDGDTFVLRCSHCYGRLMHRLNP